MRWRIESSFLTNIVNSFSHWRLRALFSVSFQKCLAKLPMRSVAALSKVAKRLPHVLEQRKNAFQVNSSQFHFCIVGRHNGNAKGAQVVLAELCLVNTKQSFFRWDFFFFFAVYSCSGGNFHLLFLTLACKIFDPLTGKTFLQSVWYWK